MKSQAISSKDIYTATHVVRFTWGLSLGIFQYTYHVFLYDHLGGDVGALSRVVSLIVLQSFLILLLEIPTGAFGDHIGRKKAVILSFAFCTASTFFRTWIYFVPSVGFSLFLAVLAVICYSFCYAFFSGSFVAWVVDSIRERGIKEGHGRLLARANGTMIVGKIVGAIIGLSFYLDGHVYYAFAFGCLAALLCTLFCAIVMRETESLEFHRGPILLSNSLNKMKDIVKIGFKVSVRTPPVAYLIIMRTAYMSLINIVIYLWPIAMKTNFGVGKMSPYWFVVVFTCFLTSLGGSKLLEFLNKAAILQNNERLSNAKLWIWFLGICFLSAGSIFILGFGKLNNALSLSVFITCMALFNVGYGFLVPAYETLINYYIPVENSKERATIMSFSSMLTSLVMILVMFPSSGPSGEDTTIGWLLPAAILFVAGSVIHVFMRRYQQKIGEVPVLTS